MCFPKKVSVSGGLREHSSKQNCLRGRSYSAFCWLQILRAQEHCDVPAHAVHSESVRRDQIPGRYCLSSIRNHNSRKNNGCFPAVHFCCSIPNYARNLPSHTDCVSVIFPYIHLFSFVMISSLKRCRLHVHATVSSIYFNPILVKQMHGTLTIEHQIPPTILTPLRFKKQTCLFLPLGMGCF